MQKWEYLSVVFFEEFHPEKKYSPFGGVDISKYLKEGSKLYIYINHRLDKEIYPFRRWKNNYPGIAEGDLPYMDYINSLGKQGWEMISEGHQGYHYLFKRELQE